MKKEHRTIAIQILLFVATFFSTTTAGAQWAFAKSIFALDDTGSLVINQDYSWADFASGLPFSISLLGILTCHEFGHYFTAIYHRVKTSLPYYLPVPPLPGLLFSLGTFGAVIRLREKPQTNLQVFDVGLAGPVAGFVVAIAFLVYGFNTLPPADYVFQFHPEYEKYGAEYADHVYTEEFMKGENVGDIIIGKNLMFLLAETFVSDKSRIPNSHELMHYPLLLGVYFALFFTALNLIPIGQFDGGHVTYGLFGFKRHRIIATVFFIAWVFYAGIGNTFIDLHQPSTNLLIYVPAYVIFMYFLFTSLKLPRQKTLMYALLMVAAHMVITMLFPKVHGFESWLILALLMGKIGGIAHPPSEIEQPLDARRVMLGWASLVIFVLCFHPQPLVINIYGLTD